MIDEWSEWINWTLIVICCISWINWIWRGYGYRGGFAATNKTYPLLWTILVAVVVL